MIHVVAFIKEIYCDVVGIMLSPQKGMRSLYGTSFYRNAVYLMLNSVILVMTGFFFWLVAARIYPAEAVGLASAAIAAMGLLAMLSSLGLNFSLIRFLPGAGEKAGEMINSCFTLGGLASVLVALIFVAGLDVWSPGLLPIRDNAIICGVFVVSVVATTLGVLGERIFVAKQMASYTLIQGLVFDLARFGPLVILLSVSERLGVFASYGMAISLAVAISIVFLIPRIELGYQPAPFLRRKLVMEMLHYSVTNYVANLLWMLPQMVLPIMVLNRLGAEESAYYYIGWAVASILFAVPMSASFSLFAEGSHSQKELSHGIRRSLKLTMLILVPGILVMLFAGDKLLFFFGRDYSENATHLVWIFTFSAIPLSVNFIYFSVKRVEMKMRNVIALSVVLSGVNLSLSYVLLSEMGIDGAGIGFLVAQSIVAAAIVANLCRRQRNLGSVSENMLSSGTS